MESQPRRAVVLGASIAGLLAARVLADRFDEVLLIERDALPTDASPRKGTPHAVHPHGLLARGREALEELLPGFTEALVARGGLLGDLQRDVAFEAGRRRYAGGTSGVPAVAVSRLAIEAELRARLCAWPRVTLIDGVDAAAPQCLEGQVNGVRYVVDRDGAPQVRFATAELVVDCTGRGSRSPQWLRDWGFDAPLEERVDIDICYTSAYFRREGACALGPGLDRVAVFGAVTNEQPYPGVLLAQEAGSDGVPRWVLGTGGFRGDHAAPTIEALRERCASIGSPEMMRVANDGTTIGKVMRYAMPHSQRRRYERLRRFPAGYLVMGDALTSFNPIYGQGMTVAACEALALREALTRGSVNLSRRFFKAAATVIDTPWQLAVGGDLSLDCVPGPRPLPVRIVNGYVAMIHRAAPDDAVVSLAFQRVIHMLDAPAKLFAPALVWRVLRHAWRRPVPTAASPQKPQASPLSSTP